MPQPDGVVFVYRSHYEGLLGKRVRRLPDRTVLDWFRRGWAAAADPATDLEAWVATELGGHVYGLASIFDAVREHELPTPTTAEELGAALARHLYRVGLNLKGQSPARALVRLLLVDVRPELNREEFAQPSPDPVPCRAEGNPLSLGELL